MTIDSSGATTSKYSSSEAPMLPTYQYRQGVTDSVDFGVRETGFSGLGADVKWNFLRGSLDLAIDPGLQWVIVPAGGGLSVFYLHAPVLVGINFTPRITLVLSPGAVYALESGSPALSPRYAVVTDGGVLARLGVGVNVRVSRELAIMPEVTAMRSFNEAEGFIVVGGVGFKFGAQPLMNGE